MGARRGAACDIRQMSADSRIRSVDAVRAVALFGILMAHSHNFFNIWQPEVPPGCCDGVWEWLYANVFVGKFFLVFAFLFGLSFFLQLDRAEAKGVDFRGRFGWRLVLLAGFGLVHSWLYCGDILLIFSITGFIPVLLWRVPTRWLVGLCGLCLLQPLALYHYASGAPTAMKDWYDAVRVAYDITWAPSAQTSTFCEMGEWNICHGVWHSFLYTVYSYRIWALVGMYLLGMIAGRLRVFQGNMPGWRFILPVASLWGLVRGLCCCYGGETYWYVIEPTLFVFWCVPVLTYVLGSMRLQRVVAPLGKLGRCTLTCYITQSIVMLWLICGYGAGLMGSLSISAVMSLGVCLYLVQLLACNTWLHFFRYGPLEGMWRYLTRLGMGR